uniref:Uncharacterized protein n=1 Tax=Globodera rostochiensis TaxID=31243 RepID=A0A914GX47_GLORO
MTTTTTTSVEELEEEKEQKMREIVVLPAPEIIDARQGTATRDVNEALEEMAKTVQEKGKHCTQYSQRLKERQLGLVA